MAIIYSYPQETNPQPTDLLIGTSTIVSNGVEENVTRSYSLQVLTDYIKDLGGQGVTSITFSGPLTGGTITSTGTVGITQSSGTSDGYLSSTDWTTFNNKISSNGIQFSIPIWSQSNALSSSSLSEPAGNYVYSNKHFSPLVDATWDLGTSTVSTRWKNIYSSATIYSSNISISGYFNTATGNGTVGQILQSQGAGQPVRWVDDALGDITGVTTATPQQLTITAGTGPVPNLDIVTGAVINAGTSLATGDQIYDFVIGQNYGTGTVTSVSIVSTEFPGITTTITNPNSTPQISLTSTGTPTATQYLDGTGNWSTPAGAGTLTGVAGTANRITIDNTDPAEPAVNADTSTGVATGSLTLATGGQIQTAINAAVAGSVTFKGGFNASTGIIDGGTDNITTIAITIGDLYVVSTAGNFYGSEPLGIGDQVICKTTAVAGASTIANWTTVEANVVPAQVGATDASTTKGVAGFDNQMFAATTDGFVTSTTLNSIIVTVAGTPSKYNVEGVAQANIYLARSSTFYINQDAASNDGHPLVLSTAAAADPRVVYSTGVVYLLDNVVTSQSDYVNTSNFDAAVGNRKIRVTLTQAAPTLSYACYIHAGMGADIVQTTFTASGVSGVTAGNGLVTSPVGGIIATGSVSPSYSTATNIILSATNGTGDTLVTGDHFMFNNTSSAVKYATLGQLSTYINAGAGTVTSVGLTMPGAFAVANSPVTNSGTLAVTPTGGVSGQYLDTTGNWSTPPNTGGTVTSVTVGSTITALSLTQTETTPAPVISLAIVGGSTGQFLKQDGTWDTVPAGYTLNIDADSGGPGAVDAAATIDIAGGTALTTALTGTSSSRVVTVNLDNTAVTPNVYASPSSVTVDQQGRVTAIVAGGGAAGVARTFIRATGDGSNKIFTGITVGANTLPAGTQRNYIDVYISGVYQSKASYTFATGTNGTVTFLVAPPVTAADAIEFVITS